MTDFDVAIVGCGPTGATLANLLALQGTKTLIIDREADIYALPRAVHFDDEVMRVFQTVGVADDLSKLVHVNPGMRFVDDQNEMLLDWPRPQEITAHGWHASYRLHQPDLERLLRDRLLEQPSISLRLNAEAREINESRDNVSLTLHDRETGATSLVRTKFIVGCDGANSFIRQTIGQGMEDLGFRERWLVVDVILKRPRPDLGDFTLQFCNADRPMTYCRSPANRRRWEIAAKDHETDNQLQNPDQIWQFLSRWVTSDDAELERSAVYTFRSAVAQKWHRDRLLIAGDAAHLTPPFMGQGMCAGIRDAANLAWKLSAAVNGADHEPLLATYQQEREPHTRAYIETAVRLGGLINSLDRSGALALADQGNEMRSITPRLGQSALSHPEIPAGTPFPQIHLSDGRRIDDVVGYVPVILTTTRQDIQSDLVCFNGEDHPQIRSALREAGSQAVLVRPDRYVAALGDAESLAEEWAKIV